MNSTTTTSVKNKTNTIYTAESIFGSYLAEKLCKGGNEKSKAEKERLARLYQDIDDYCEQA